MVNIGLLLIILPSVAVAWYLFSEASSAASYQGPENMLGILFGVWLMFFLAGWWIVPLLLLFPLGLIIVGIFLIVSSKSPQEPV